MRRKYAYAVVAVIAAVLLPGTAASAIEADPATAGRDGVQTHDYEPSSDAIRNPDRGLYWDEENFQTLDKARAKHIAESGWSLLHGANDLSAFTTTPISQDWLNGFSKAFDHVRDNGMKVVLHFTYSPHVATDAQTACDPNVVPAPDENVPPDASLELITQQLVQLRPIIEANIDVVSSIDAGFAGEWGEWHCSTNLLLSDENKPKLFEALFDGLPESRQINFRYPADIFEYLAANPDRAPRIANYQACYASGDDGGDMGTWPTNDPVAQQAMKEQLGHEVGSHAFIGLVVCNKPSTNPDRLTCDTAVGPDGQSGEFALMHVTYFDGTFDKARFGPGYADCWDDIVNRLGYRLALDHADLPQQVLPGAEMPVSISLSNVGFASVIAERPVYLVFENGTAREAVRLEADPRQWASMTDATIVETVRVPRALPAGEYRLALWLPDPSSTLQAQSEYSVQLANTGVWNEHSGDNTLAEGLRVGPPQADEPSLAATGIAVLPIAGVGALLALLGIVALRSAALRRRSALPPSASTA